MNGRRRKITMNLDRRQDGMTKVTFIYQHAGVRLSRTRTLRNVHHATWDAKDALLTAMQERGIDLECVEAERAIMAPRASERPPARR